MNPEIICSHWTPAGFMLYLAGTLYRTPRQITGLLFYLDRPTGWLVSLMYPNISGYLMDKKKKKKAGSEV